MAEYYLAVDIGASSGRHILGTWKTGKSCWRRSTVLKTGWKKRTVISAGTFPICSMRSKKD